MISTRSSVLYVQCFLGDDYGTVPVPAAIEQQEFHQLRNELFESGEGQLLVCKTRLRVHTTYYRRVIVVSTVAQKVGRSVALVSFRAHRLPLIKDGTGVKTVKPRPHQQHVEATCRTLLRHVEATFDMSKQHVERCFDMLPVAVRHVASTCCWCGRGLRAGCQVCRG